MASPKARFRVIHESNCPIYKTGEEFSLSGNALLVEPGQEKLFITTAVINLPNTSQTCRSLIADLTKIVIEHESINKIPDRVLNCGGCSGFVTLEYTLESEEAPRKMDSKLGENIDALAVLLSKFSIFQTLEGYNLRDFISFLKVRKFDKGATIIEKGEPGQNLYIILSGGIEVLNDDGNLISSLRQGEVFGEMSLISGDPVGATIKAVAPTSVFYIKGQDFIKNLNRYPALQMYFARLLAHRLAKSNVVRSGEFTSGMVGQLSEMPTTELLQTLNAHQKTGVLSLDLPRGEARISFRKGRLIKVNYQEKEGKEAFFDILKEADGRFKFTSGLSRQETEAPEIGFFMELLLEGLRRMDDK
ncbi:MAG: cyclic nucleotide-binding domain-containing protein [Desulfobacterales bacterium]|nr:cyclic nucleotide-binding domain-containing protein [Desulfobacterales bacterium]